MNKVGIYFAYWTRDWAADYKYYINKVAQLGFDILEVCTANLIDLSKIQKREIKATADAVGISLTYCLGTAPEYDMSSLDPSVRMAGVEYAKRTLETIYELGGRTYGGINYACWPVKNLPKDLAEKQRYWNNSVTSLRQVMPTACNYGIDYCFEIVNRFEQFILNTAAEGVRFCQEVGSPKAKLLLDTFHMNIEEDSFSDAIITTGNFLGHLHIGEPNRKTPGTGRMPWYEMAHALKKIEYEGHVVMEPFIVPGGQVGEDIRIWRDLSNAADEASMDEKARKACSFIKSVFESVE